MSQLVVRLLGAPQFEHEGELITPTQRKPIALLAYLAFSGQPQRRDTLAALLWPAFGQRGARTNLRRTLWELKQTRLGDWLEIEREQAGLHAGDDVWVDTDEFQRLLVDLRGQAEKRFAQMDRLQAAADLVRGEFLAGFTLDDSTEFDDWQRFQSEHLRRELAWVLERLVDQGEQTAAYPGAIANAQRWLALDPLAESVHRRLMRLYAASGERTAALRQYRAYARLLQEELGVLPEEETDALYDAIRLGQVPATGYATRPAHDGQQVAVAPVLAPLDPSEPPHNLPSRLTSFVGREEEIDSALRLLQDPDCRLLTITGIGGVGKTRLALAVAEHALHAYPHGVFLVSLVGTAAPEHLAAAIVEALEPHVGGSGDSHSRLLNFVAARRLLLILDSFEHLRSGAPYVSELLAHAPGLQLLVTSRERLNLQEEWGFSLAGLPYPDKAGAPVRQAHTSVALFLQRARQQRSDFSAADEEESVAAICRLVEGIPLGIELAATWVRTMSCAGIAAELSRDFGFLSSPFENQPPQHRSLRAVFECSWEMLSAEEQHALCRLAVFHGGFDPAAAASVAGADAHLLARLVDRSLIRRQPTRSEHSRFDLHELLRQFAAEKLAATPGESEEARRRHSRYTCRWLSTMAWPLEQSDIPREIWEYTETCSQIAGDIDNVRAAWQWAVRRRDGEAVRQAMDALAFYYSNSLEAAEAERVFGEAVASFQDAAEMPDVEKSQLCGLLLSRLAYCVSDDHSRREQSADILAQSLALLRHTEADNRFDIAINLVLYAQCMSSLGRQDVAITYADEGLALFRELAHPLGLGWGLYHRALRELAQGRPKSAAVLYQEARANIEASPNRYWSPAVDLNLGVVYMAQGRYVDAQELLERALANRPHESGAHFCLRQLGDLATATGGLEQAEHYFAAAASRLEHFGISWQLDLPFLLGPGVTARLQGDFEKAERLLQRSVATAREVGFHQRVATSLYNLSRLRHDQGRYIEAKELLDEALSVAERIDFQVAGAFILCQLGHEATAQNQPDADAYYVEALEIALDQEIDRVALEVLTGLATQLVRRSDLEPAVRLLVLAQTHPAAEYETRRTARRLLDELEETLSPDEFTLAVDRGQRADLHTTLREFLSRPHDR